MLRENLQKLLKESGMSQTALAKKAGVSKTYIWQLLNEDAKSPGIDIMIKIAAVFGVTVDDIIHNRKGKLIKAVDEEYQTACIRCGRKSNLSIIPHRLNNRVVGMVFCCANCNEYVYNADIELVYSAIDT